MASPVGSVPERHSSQAPPPSVATGSSSAAIDPHLPATGSPWNQRSQSQAPKVSVQIEAGVARADIPDDVIYGSQPLWTDYLVGFFIDEPPTIAKLHSTINRLWRTKKQTTFIDVKFLNPTTAIFCIPNKKSRDWILEKHVWHIGTTPMLVQQWSPTNAKASPDMTRIPVWVDFFNVPDFLFAEKGLKFLGDIVGKYQKLHPSTEKCLKLDVARVLVVVNFESDLINTVVLNETGKEITVKVSYPWVPKKCDGCKKWGHVQANCPLEKKEHTGAAEGVGLQATSSAEPMKEGAAIQISADTTNTSLPTQDQPKQIATCEPDITATDTDEAGWTTVTGRKSPRKSVSPPRELHDNSVPETNKFLALQTMETEEEEGEILREETNQATQDNFLENVNVTMDEHSADVNKTTIEHTSDTIQDVTRAGGGGTRGARGRGRPRKNVVSHQDLSVPQPKNAYKASFGKH